jgi:DNA helicase-2/ATP-dependent DNA helicase PcrA
LLEQQLQLSGERLAVNQELHPAIQEHYTYLNEKQQEAVARTDGPLLIIAGPGSGKTLVLVVRTLNILLQGKAEPKEIVLCTFTEKAAFELRDRVVQAARTLGYTGDLSQLQVGTIHSICNDHLTRFRHHTWLGGGYEVLDELTQALFLFENFEDIASDAVIAGKYLAKWSTRWTAIQGLIRFFNKMTEELVDPGALVASPSPFLQQLGVAYQQYEQALQDRNRLDFAHQQKLFYELLHDPEIAEQVQAEARYVMVDEYQDTNYIQEQLLLCLAHPQDNFCVVGDDDQSLYRFRGATVRNILEFSKYFDSCPQVRLTVNYRSHRRIIAGYNRFMEGCDWSNPGSRFDFRYDKTIEPNEDEEHPDYPAVFAIWGADRNDEAGRVADLVGFLKENAVIEDYNQVAFLLYSVRAEHSEPYTRALERRGIPAFAPRARAYFGNEEVLLLVGCFAVLLGWYGDNRGNLSGYALRDLADYVDGCLTVLARAGVVDDHPLARVLQRRVAEIEGLREGETLNRHLADYFYEFVAHEPFASMMGNENRARNLAIFSQLMAVFQHYYHYTIITHANRGHVRLHFFNSFLRFLYMGGINEYEDPDRPFPSGHVQLMTIHQSKGLEFPVVIVGSLALSIKSGKQEDRLLGPFYHREPFEPEKRITEFDRMRLHYVAFSRAEKVLVLTTTDTPKPHFSPIWQGLPQWPYVQQDLLAAQHFELKERVPIKKTFSFTNHLKVYETCPRQYQFFREYEFAPSRSAEIFFGALVHQTIEDIHRWVLEGQALKLIEKAIPGMFEANFRGLVNTGYRPISDIQRQNALAQVKNYFRQNQDRMERVIETEVDVSLEKATYILTGRVDLLLGEDDKLELLDFKSQPRPEEDDRRLSHYYQQLLIYAHILEQRYGKRPERLALYWTGEARRDDALMLFPYDEGKVAEAGAYFDSVVDRILARDFAVRRPPERKVCAECDFRAYCAGQGVVTLGQ